MFSYAGVPLAYHEESVGVDVAGWVQENIRPDQLFPLAYRSWPGELTNGPILNATAEEPRPVQIGCFYWPWSASRFARAHFVVTEQQLTAIRNSVFQYGAQTSAIFKIDDGTNSVPTALWMLPAIPLQKAVPGAGLYLLTLVDDRYFWWQTPLDMDVIAGHTSWNGLYADIGSALGQSVANDPVALDYGSPTQDYETGARPLPMVFDAVAFSVQQRVVRSLNGVVSVQNFTTANATVTANQVSAPNKYAGGAFDLNPFLINDLPALVPAQVTVAFPTTGDNAPATGYYKSSVTLTSLHLASFANIVGAPWNRLLHRYEMAIYMGGGSPINSAAIAVLVKQLAADWYQWQLAPLDQYFVGAVNWTPEGFHDIEWEQRHGRITTGIKRRHFNPTDDLLTIAGKAPPEPGPGPGPGPGPFCFDYISKVCPTFNSSGVIVGIIDEFTEICWENGQWVKSTPVCIPDPLNCCDSPPPTGNWFCVSVQNCTNSDCSSCDAPSGTECVQVLDASLVNVGDTRCVNLGDGTYRRETALSIWSTQALCLASCGGITTTCCSVVPQNLCALISNQSGMACAPTSFDINYKGVDLIPCDPEETEDCLGCAGSVGPIWDGQGKLGSCGHSVRISIGCFNQQWYVRFEYTDACGDTAYFSNCNGGLTIVQCSPFHIQFAVASTVACGGTALVNGLLIDIFIGPCPGTDTPPTVTLNTANQCNNVATMTITGTNFDAGTPSNNIVIFNLGAAGHVTAATSTTLTVTMDAWPTATGSLTAIVINGNGSSAPPVQVATITDCGGLGCKVSVDFNDANIKQTATQITITGIGFNILPANNTVTLVDSSAVTVYTGPPLTVSADGKTMVVPITTTPALGILTAVVVVTTGAGCSSAPAVEVGIVVAGTWWCFNVVAICTDPLCQDCPTPFDDFTCQESASVNQVGDIFCYPIPDTLNYSKRIAIDGPYVDQATCQARPCGGGGHGSQTFIANGTFKALITGNHTFEGWGTGEDGSNPLVTGNASGGGIGGDYASATVALTAGDTVAIVIGSHGHPAGDTTAIKTGPTTIILAKGGGSGSANVGTTTHTGGSVGGTGTTGGGGGGGSAGSTGNGSAGSNGSGSSGGAGGAGGTGTSGGGGAGGNNGANGAAGAVPGGGGGGCGAGGNVGPGGRGQVKVTW